MDWLWFNNILIKIKSIKRLSGAFFIDINSITCYTQHMKIERALDWNKVSSDLSSQMNGIGYNPDLHVPGGISDDNPGLADIA
jgi:hypothetical protein